MTTPADPPATPDDAENVLRRGLTAERVAPPCTVVIFGATGDLTKRKLVPALYSLSRQRLLDGRLAVIGFARRDIGNDGFRDSVVDGCAKASGGELDQVAFDDLAEGISYVQGNFDEPDGYERLGKKLDEVERGRGLPGNRLFYLSTPPWAFTPVVRRLSEAGLLPRGPQQGDQPFARVVIEKPFGTSLGTARELNRALLDHVDERQIFRIDHYLGKETVQNLLTFRFANGIFEPLLTGQHVDHVQITSAEALGIEGRGGYFEDAGILRDMVQNHMFQVLALTALEPPVSLEADDLRDEKVKVMKALRPVPEDAFVEHVARGQYTRGFVSGREIPSYREEKGVADDSATETYVALKLFIDNWRWGGVPFYLRAAKAMPKKVTEVAVVFKEPPRRFPGLEGAAGQGANVLSFRIQPDEGITIRFGAKLPGPVREVHPVQMEFRYGTSFGSEPPEAYERLLLDAMVGDPSLFTRADEVEASWRYVTRVHELWGQRGPGDLETYEAGSWGPAAADALLERDGRRWRRP